MKPVFLCSASQVLASSDTSLSDGFHSGGDTSSTGIRFTRIGFSPATLVASA
jgi:hypothetical protein